MRAAALRSIVAGALLAAFPALCAAQADAPVPRPEVKIGDSWTYRRIDLQTNKPTGFSLIRVTFANDRAIQTTSHSGRKEQLDATWTAEWNAVSSPRDGIFEPHRGLLKFPLQAGATYKVVYDMKRPQKGAFQAKHDRTAKVVGWEEVEVPAGKFRALKIEIEGTFQRVDKSIAGTAKNVIWYVPEVKRWVKWAFEIKASRGPLNGFALELVEYKVQ